MSLIDLLLWAVNPALPNPPEQDIDGEQLTSLAIHHRVLPRLVARLDKERPSWFPTSLRMQLRFMAHHSATRAREQIAQARAITQACLQRGLPPPLLIKGFSAYALTGRSESLQASGDLDFFAADLPAFWDVLHELGYTGKRKYTHEWAKMTRDDYTIDIHQYYPVLSYPQDVCATSLETLQARNNPNRWAMPVWSANNIPETHRLTYKDLAKNAVQGIASGTEDIYFPSPALLCIVSCAHCFKSMATSLYYMNTHSDFRLHELLGVSELARTPGFDHEQFCDLSNRLGAWDSVEQMNGLSRCYLNTLAVPDSITNRMATPTPLLEHLVYGGWVSLQKTQDWLSSRGIDKILDQMGANVVQAPFAGELASFNRILTYGDTIPTPHIHVWFEPVLEMTNLELSFAGDDLEQGIHEILVHLGSDTSVSVCLDEKGTITKFTPKSDYWGVTRQNAVSATAVPTPTGVMVRLHCPAPELPARRARQYEQRIPLFLAVCRFADPVKQDAKIVDAVCYIPLYLSTD